MAKIKSAAAACALLLAAAAVGNTLWTPAPNPMTPVAGAGGGYPPVMDMRPFQQAFS